MSAGVGSEPPARAAGIGAVAVTSAVSIITAPEGTVAIAVARTEAKAGPAIVAVDARVTSVSAAPVLALAAADEVVIAGDTGVCSRVGVVSTIAPAPEALLGAIGALERLAAATAEVAISGLARRALLVTIGEVGRGSFTGRGLFEALLEVGAVGGELLFELIAEQIEALTAAPPARAGIAGAVSSRAVVV